MLAIRMQRTGRKGHAMFRLVVQDARLTPTSGKVVAQLGHYDPHSKAITLDKEKAGFYLEHGAQPSDRIAKLMQGEGVKLPSWVKVAGAKQRTIRNLEKLRRNAPKEAASAEAEPAVEPSAADSPTEEPAAAEEAATPAEPVTEAPAPAEPVEEPGETAPTTEK